MRAGVMRSNRCAPCASVNRRAPQISSRHRPCLGPEAAGSESGAFDHGGVIKYFMLADNTRYKRNDNGEKVSPRWRRMSVSAAYRRMLSILGCRYEAGV